MFQVTQIGIPHPSESTTKRGAEPGHFKGGHPPPSGAVYRRVCTIMIARKCPPAESARTGPRPAGVLYDRALCTRTDSPKAAYSEKSLGSASERVERTLSSAAASYQSGLSVAHPYKRL